MWLRRLSEPGTNELAGRVAELAAQSGDPLVEGLSFVARSYVSDPSVSIWDSGPEVLELRRAALERFREAGSMLDVVQTLANLAVSQAAVSEDGYLAMAHEIADLAKEIGATVSYKVTVGNLALAYAMRGENDRAEPYLHENLRWLRTAGAPPSWTGFAALTASSVFRARGDLLRAAELAGAAAALSPERESVQFRWAPTELLWRDENLEALREALGDDFERAIARGALLSPDQVIDLASGRRAPGDPVVARVAPR
jgi:hypothetical protein